MMKRGLSTLDVNRTPLAIYKGRQERLRQSIRDNGLDAALVYGDVSTGNDIAFLTHSTLYWAHAILVVPVHGPIVLVMTLSPRTQDWFDATSVLDEMISGPNMAGIVQTLCTERGYGRVGLVDQDYFPADMLDTIAAEGKVQLQDLGPIVRELRTVPDDAALADLAQVARVGASAFDSATQVADFLDADLVRAEAEFAMRAAGAWDTTAVVTPAAGGGLVVQLRCQIRDAWYGAERLVAGAADVTSAARSLYEQMIGALRPGISEGQLQDFVQSKANALAAWPDAVLDVVLETAPDIEQRRVLGGEPDSGFVEGSVLHAALWAWNEDGSPVMAFGDTFRITASGAVPTVT